MSERMRLPEKLTSEQARQLRDALTSHYGQRVAPVSEFCEALREWARVMVDSGYAPQVGEYAGEVMFLLAKSNLAHRLMYLGEATRTEPCPVHKGRWSGCVFFDDEPCECMSGANVTGWLPPPSGAKPDLNPPIRGVILRVPVPAEPLGADDTKETR